MLRKEINRLLSKRMFFIELKNNYVKKRNNLVY